MVLRSMTRDTTPWLASSTIQTKVLRIALHKSLPAQRPARDAASLLGRVVVPFSNLR